MFIERHDEELIQHLSQSLGLAERQANRLVQEVLSYFDESVVDFVQRRHQELQRSGLSNTFIFQQILDEVKERRFPTEGLSERKVRRMIYG